MHKNVKLYLYKSPKDNYLYVTELPHLFQVSEIIISGKNVRLCTLIKMQILPTKDFYQTLFTYQLKLTPFKSYFLNEKENSI